MRFALLGGSLRRAVLTVTSLALVAVSAVGVALAFWGQQRTFGEAERLLLDTQGKVV
ncbi:MAG: hypothetical protein HY728_08035, partial [Candidatus Rokubacteria bacterium]|nr:hypothetical protein [Candidatus Rokubacteria bacterium]